MVGYILITILTGTIILVLLYLIRRLIPVSWKVICIVAGLSMILSLTFPYFLGYFKFKFLVLAYFCLISAAALVITAMDTRTRPSLEELISRAFEAKHKRDYTSAAEYFKKALRLKPESKLAVLLAADISGIYRNLGRYEDALQILRSTLRKEKSSLDQSLVQKINEDLDYLAALYSLLKKAGQADLPYVKVSSDFKRKAEEIIKKSRKE